MNDANPEMSDANKCPQCGTPLKSPALGGLCPACLLKEGATGDTATGGRFPFFEPPTVTELAVKFPQLEVLELIGKGGMGAVYKARQKELDRIVALKILPPGIGNEAGFAERFSREAKALAKLNHSNIVTIHEFGRADGLYFFVMEFVDGVNLRQLLQGSRISPHEALAIVPQICDALQFAHDHGIVHRDIKPENILMDRRGRVKVADFGLAKIVGMDAPLTPSLSPSDGERVAKPGEWNPVLTEAGKVMGTPQYMAPEQKDRPLEVDHRADIYALGVVFYQMLTGELPGKPIIPPSSNTRGINIDARLDEIVLRALEKKPELRYQQVSEVKTCVENITGSAGVSPAESGVAPDSPKTNLEERAAGGPPTAATGPVALPEPRFSRTAIVGATWVALFFLMAIGPLSWNYGGQEWLRILMFMPVWLGLAGVLGATILGWISVAQIRRSAGKIYGLGLAVFDGLLFPLLLLDGLLCGLFIKMGKLLADFHANLAQANNPQVHPSFLTRVANHLAEHPFEIPILIAVAISIIVNLFIIRRVWRCVNKPHNETRKSGEAPVARRKVNPAVMVAVALSMIIGILGFTLLANLWHTNDSRVGNFSSIKNLFDPEKEMILNIGDGKNSFFRLGSEDFVDGPKDFDPTSSSEDQKLWKWLTAHGVDLLVQRKDGKPILAMSDMVVSTIDEKDFDRIRTVEQLEKDVTWHGLKDAQIRPAVQSILRGAFGGTATFAFQTRYDTVGLLQVMGVVNDPPGVKIRYKLVQNAHDETSPIGEVELQSKIEKKLRRLSLNWDSMELDFNTPNHKGATASFVGLKEMKGIDGKNVWMPIDGSLIVHRMENYGAEMGVWKIRGTEHLGHVEFTVQINRSAKGDLAKAYKEVIQSYGSVTPPSAKEQAHRREIASRSLAAPDVPALRAKIEQLIGHTPGRTSYDFEIWEKVPGVAGEYRIRSDVKQIKLDSDTPTISSPMGKVYFLTASNRFYIQWDALGASTLHYYGPFAGDPVKVLGLGTSDFGPESERFLNEQALTATNAVAAFGPVIEMVVNDDGAKRDFFIDLENGKLHTPPPGLNPRDTNAFLAWVRSNGIDAAGETSVSVRGLVGIEMIVRPLAAPRWATITPDAALSDDSLRLSTAGTPVFMSAKGELPETFLFKTRESGVGVLQITGFSDNPHGVKIRYKLVQNATQSQPTKITSDNALSFGVATNGLCAALELIPSNGVFVLNEPIEVRIHIRNVSKTNIVVAGGSWRQDDAHHLTIRDERGKKMPSHHIWYSGLTTIQRNELKPGETVAFLSSALEFISEADEKTAENPVGNYVNVKPGRYTVTYRVNFPDVIDGGASFPVDWQGEIETAPVTVSVKATNAVSQSKRQRFVPQKGIAEKTSWNVMDKPSELNPKGWAIMAHMTLGGVVPARMPGETNDFCRIKMTEGNDDSITLQIDDLSQKSTVTVTLNRDQHAEILVDGKGYRVGYPSMQVALKDADTSPFALVIVTRSEKNDGK